MKFHETPIDGVVLIEPQVFGDARGFFMETWQSEKFAAAGIEADVRARQSQPLRPVDACAACICRSQHTQGKLVRVAAGSVFDVVVDLRAQLAEFRRVVGRGAVRARIIACCGCRRAWRTAFW